MTNDELPEPDFDFDEETEDDQTPDYWACYGCAKTSSTYRKCPICSCDMEAEYF